MLKPECLRNIREERAAFHRALRAWFERAGEDHPWRATQDPWAILISEIMLQQTTVGAVRAGRRFERFLAEFPTIESISEAPEEQLLKAWEGLGYYNRVRNLQKTARAVLADWEGEFPRNAADLQTLPGVGPYTAGAITSFAFDEPAPLVDGNVARVFARLFDDGTEIDSTLGKQQLWRWAEELLDRAHPRLFNSALMEVGQVFCRPKKPDCLACPIAEFCRTREPEALPRKKEKAKTVLVVEHALVARAQGQILLAKEDGTRRRGFYRLPLRTAEEVADLARLSQSKYTITKHRVTLNLYQADGACAQLARLAEEWFPLAKLADLPMPSPIRKALEKVLNAEA